jgi:surface antigen
MAAAPAGALAAAPATTSATTASGASVLPTLWWEPWAVGFWIVNHAAITQLFNNGQCTEWAAHKRPALVREMVEARVADEVRHQHPEILPDLDARYWPKDASAAGVATGPVPVRGALVVFQPGVLGATAHGHIAYVEHVFRNGSFKISQMDAPVLYRVTHERLPSWTARLRGVRFIYWQGEQTAATTRS